MNQLPWKYASASVIGTAHIATGSRLQDCNRCFDLAAKDPWFVAVVSDGAGSAEKGGEAASLVCRTIKELARSYASENTQLPPDETLMTWVETARLRLFAASEKRDLPVRDFAATLVFLMANSEGAICAHIGDGCIVGKGALEEGWEVVSSPENGEYVSTTFFITDNSLSLRIVRLEESYSAFVIFSDGIERIALDLTTGLPLSGFFDAIVRPLTLDEGIGRSQRVSSELGNFLASQRVNERTDDDKTVVIAVRQ